MITSQVTYYTRKMHNLQTIETPKKAKNSYLCYKTITLQNVSSEAQLENFFILKKSCVPFSRFSSFCIFKYFHDLSNL